MVITFVCGCLEPGKDGVGDYVRQLAKELSRKGNQISMIALNDPEVGEVKDDCQMQDGLAFSVLRLPTTLSNKTKLELINQFLQRKEVDWISLQFVPFSFDDRGIPYRLGGLLKSIRTKARWHIMFHELWVGMETTASPKLRVWGWMQRVLISYLLNTLRPAVVHTHTSLYKNQLALLGRHAERLPLFSNIPVKGTKMGGGGQLVFVLFGNIHYGAPLEDLIEDVLKVKHLTGKQSILKAVGRCGSELQHWRMKWEAAGLEFIEYGEKSEEEISQILSESDIGITTTPALLVEKSGTVAAMIEHELPVICVSRRWDVRKMEAYKMAEGVHIYKSGMLEDSLGQVLSERPGSINTASVSAQFIKDLIEYG